MTQAAFRDGTPMQMTYAPLRTLRDVEELERVPLDERIFSWNLNDWIARGCALDPDKIAIRYIADGDPDSEPVSHHAIASCRSRAIQAANLFHSLGVSAGRRGAVRAADAAAALRRDAGRGRGGHRLRRQLDAQAGAAGRAVRATSAKVVVALGPTPGYEIWENLQAIRAEISPAVRILTVPGPGGTAIPESDFDTLAARQPGDRLLFAAQGRARRHRRLCAFRRHHRLAQAGEAHAPRLLPTSAGPTRW